MLDDLHLVPNISYSLAFYEQDYEAYLEELKSYKEKAKENKVIVFVDEEQDIKIKPVFEEKDKKIIELNYKNDDGEKYLIEFCKKEELNYDKAKKSEYYRVFRYMGAVK